GKRDRDAWLYNSLEHNLKAVGQLDTNFVTKHVVKGRCPLFALYLDAHPEAKVFFKPLMGFYGKSALNREAYIKDIMKYSSVIDVGRVDTDAFETAASNVFHYINNSGFVETTFVTDTDAIFGSLNMKAAVGALYKGKKSEYFEGSTLHDRDVLLQESCKRLYFGQMGVWNGNLKAELRPVEKIRENKTRTFTAAPIETLLGAKVCVDDFNNQFYDHHTECPWTVGISKFYGGWDKLMRKLPEGWIYCDADGSRFDSSLTPYLINSVLQIRLMFAEDWDIGREMLKNLYTEIMYTPIATPDGTIYKKFRGNNSGQPSTVVDNTLMVFISLLYSLEKSGIDTENFEEFIVFFINGDDLIIAVRPDMEKQILDPMSDNFLSLGLNYDFSNRVKDKSELWFMSHQAVLSEGKYIPKLEPARIVSILEWTRSKEPEHRLEAICAAMIEAWGHDDLLMEIRKFYAWILEQEPYSHLAKEGKAPFISELALRQLYLNKGTKSSEFLEYLDALCEMDECETSEDESESVCYQ
nr:NIb protein [Daphne mosaic virus]